MADDNFSDLKSLAEMAVEYLDLLTSSTQKLNEAQTENTEYLNLLIDATKEQTGASQRNKKATDEETKAKKLASGIVKFFTSAVSAAAREAINVGNAGFKLATTLGTSATKGVELEINNRKALFSQIGKVNADLAVSMDQLNAAQTGFTEAFVGLRAGTQISAEGSRQFASDLNKGFGSEFQATPETFRILTQMGMSSATQMQAFTKATGRASLSSGQLATLYNKNTLSFLLYGNSFGRAAVQAERLGVNLASVQAAQEGLVTNLDGTIDTVAQMNQLGANIDFGNLVRIAETEGPDALMAYVRSTVPANMMQSASTRALFKQLGISVEDYMKSGQKQVSAADQLEAKMTEAATAASKEAEVLAGVTRANQLLEDTLGELFTATKQAAAALLEFAADLARSGIAKLLLNLMPGGSPGGGPTSLLNTIGSKIPLGGGLTMGSAAGFGSVGAGLATIGTALAGLAGGLFIGDQINKALGAATLTDWWRNTTLLGLRDQSIADRENQEATNAQRLQMAQQRGFSSWDAFVASNRARAQQRANDLISTPGYGQRTLLTPKGTFSLNNADTLLAGTNLFGQTTNMQSSRERTDNTALVRKIEELITMLSTATTTINVNNTVQQVPRMSMVGVYSRNERV